MAYTNNLHTYQMTELKNYRLYKSVLPIERLFYYWRCLFSKLKLYARYDRWDMASNTHHNLFPIWHFVCACTHTCNLKTIGHTPVYGCYTYQTTAPLSEISVFCVRAGCKIQLASSSSKNISQSLFDKPFVHTYKHNLKTTGRIWTFYILNDCSNIGDIPCMV